MKVYQKYLRYEAQENLDPIRKKWVRYLNQYSSLLLTPNGYTSKIKHLNKALEVMRLIFDKGSISQWDLSKKTSLNNDTSSLTSYSWVLIHKIIRELLQLGMVVTSGFSEPDIGSNNTKHRVTLYSLSNKGFVFLFMLSKHFFEQFKHSNRQLMREESIDDLALNIRMVEYIWILTTVEKEPLYDLRRDVMYGLLVSRREHVSSLMTTDLTFYLFDKTLTLLMGSISNLYSKEIFSCMYGLAMFKGVMTINSSERENLKRVFNDLYKLILAKDIELDFLKSFLEKLTGQKLPNRTRSYRHIRNKILLNILSNPRFEEIYNEIDWSALTHSLGSFKNSH